MYITDSELAPTTPHPSSDKAQLQLGVFGGLPGGTCVHEPGTIEQLLDMRSHEVSIGIVQRT